VREAAEDAGGAAGVAAAPVAGRDTEQVREGLL